MSLHLSRDETRIVSAGGDDHRVRVWNTANGELIQSLEGHRNSVASVRISADGRTVFSASLDGQVIVWDVAAGKPKRSFDKHGCEVWAIALAPAGNEVATAGEDGVVRIWDPATGTERLTLRGHSARVEDMAFSADGRHLLSAGSELRAWDARSGESLWVNDTAGGFRVTTAAPGSLGTFATFHKGTLRLWRE